MIYGTQPLLKYVGMFQDVFYPENTKLDVGSVYCCYTRNLALREDGKIFELIWTEGKYVGREIGNIKELNNEKK